jgi:O-antigen/teichoic acid export membrane protein
MDSIKNPKKHQTLLQRALHNFTKVISGKAVGAALALAYLALAARGLGTHDFGLIVLIHSYMLLFTRIISFKSYNIIVKFGADYLELKKLFKFQKLIKFTFLLDFLSAVIGMVVGISIMYLFGEQLGIPSTATIYASLYCLLCMTNINDTTSGLLRLFNRFDLIAYQSLVEPFIRLIGVGVAFYLNAPWQIYLIVWFVGRFVVSMVMLLSSFNELRRQNLLSSFNFSFSKVSTGHKNIWPFAWSSNLHGTVNSVGIQIATLLIGGTLGPTGAALYKVAQEISEVTIKAASVFSSALYPELAKLSAAADRRTEEISAAILRTAKTGFIIGILFTSIMFLSGELLLQLVFGSEYVDGYRVLVLLSIGATIALAAFPHEAALYSIGKPETALYSKLVSSTTHMIALAMLLGPFGIVGTGYASIIANTVGAMLLLMLTKRVLKYN